MLSLKNKIDRISNDEDIENLIQCDEEFRRELKENSMDVLSAIYVTVTDEDDISLDHMRLRAKLISDAVKLLDSESERKQAVLELKKLMDDSIDPFSLKSSLSGLDIQDTMPQQYETSRIFGALLYEVDVFDEYMLSEITKNLLQKNQTECIIGIFRDILIPKSKKDKRTRDFVQGFKDDLMKEQTNLSEKDAEMISELSAFFFPTNN